MRGVRFIVFAVALAFVSGCGGWHLRGAAASADGHRYAYFLRASGANEVFIALRQEIRNRGAILANTASKAQVVVDIERERFDRRILSIDPNTGKPVGSDDAFFGEINNELADKGFLVTSTDELINWSRTGMWSAFITARAWPLSSAIFTPCGQASVQAPHELQ